MGKNDTQNVPVSNLHFFFFVSPSCQLTNDPYSDCMTVTVAHVKNIIIVSRKRGIPVVLCKHFR